jgi:hypothetical protein
MLVTDLIAGPYVPPDLAKATAPFACTATATSSSLDGRTAGFSGRVAALSAPVPVQACS